MNTFIVLFRGINVGGNNLLKMADLKQWLAEADYQNIQSYIQSGNVVLQSAVKDVNAVSNSIKSIVKSNAGFEPETMVILKANLLRMIQQNPFPTDDGKALHFYILKTPASSPNLEKLSELKTESEDFKLTDSVFYLHAPNGIGRSKLAAAVEKQLAVAVTARNWNTIAKLESMMSQTF